MKKCRLMIFASGSGSNAERMFEYFKENEGVEIAGLICNKPGAKVFERAERFNVPAHLISNEDANSGLFLNDLCKNVDLVILAGYLRKIPVDFIKNFEEKIINVHPSLLPNYGGKGMYGANVHKAVLANHEKETGITIHFVNENFDEGRILAQFRTKLESEDVLEDVQRKIHFLEQNYFPVVVNTVIKQM